MLSLVQIQSAIPASPVCFVPLVPPAGGFVPLFEAAGQTGGALGSLNAGNSDPNPYGLYVGGGGINGAFGFELGPTANVYQGLHQALLAQISPGQTRASTPYPASPASPLSFSCVQLPSAVLAGLDGIVFVDVFAPGFQPNGNPSNAAMVYVAPPNGSHYASASQFLAAISTTASNVIETVAWFNQLSATQPGLEPLKILRAALFSSSIYAFPGVSSQQVACAVMTGFLSALGNGPTGLTEIQLPTSTSTFPAF